MVTMASIRYFCIVEERMMALSLSRTRSFSTRIWRRMLASSGLAWSLISSSEMMASKISSSRERLVARREPSSVRFGVSSRSVTSALRTIRAAFSASATCNRALGDSVPPAFAIFKNGRTSVKWAMGLPPL